MNVLKATLDKVKLKELTTRTCKNCFYCKIKKRKSLFIKGTYAYCTAKEEYLVDINYFLSHDHLEIRATRCSYFANKYKQNKRR